MSRIKSRRSWWKIASGLSGSSRWRRSSPFLYTETVSEETNGHDSPSRLDRLEKVVEALANVQVDMQQEHGILLRAQVLMSEDLRALTERLRVLAEKTDERFRETDERFRETDERFRAVAEAQTALMGTMDQIIRKLP